MGEEFTKPVNITSANEQCYRMEVSINGNSTRKGCPNVSAPRLLWLFPESYNVPQLSDAIEIFS